MESPVERWFHSKSSKLEFQQAIKKISGLYNTALSMLGVVTKELSIDILEKRWHYTLGLGDW